jgi:hypothetical protein
LRTFPAAACRRNELKHSTPATLTEVPTQLTRT